MVSTSPGQRPWETGPYRRWATAVAVALVLCSVVLCSAAAFGPVPPSGAATRQTKTLYYLAMGDSLAAGTGASTVGNEYVSVLYRHELSRFPTLELDNLGCGGATTNSVILGPGCAYATGTQLGDAEAFLRAHPGQVPFLTIDIGANNVDGCQSGESFSVSCVQNGESLITSQLPQILSGLRAAYPGLAIYGMDYYDPFLGEWLTGAAGQGVAEASEQLAVQLNALLEGIYSAGGAATADPATSFQTADFAPTGSYLGVTEPQNVANICNWTLFCSDGGNIHANDIGHFLLAESLAQVVDHVSVATTTLPPASVGVRYAEALGASGGHPPYHWRLAASSAPLPTGVTLRADGALEGRPSVAGTYSFTVEVEDSRLAVTPPPARSLATATLSITVG